METCPCQSMQYHQLRGYFKTCDLHLPNPLAWHTPDSSTLQEESLLCCIYKGRRPSPLPQPDDPELARPLPTHSQPGFGWESGRGLKNVSKTTEAAKLHLVLCTSPTFSRFILTIAPRLVLLFSSCREETEAEGLSNYPRSYYQEVAEADSSLIIPCSILWSFHHNTGNHGRIRHQLSVTTKAPT